MGKTLLWLFAALLGLLLACIALFAISALLVDKRREYDKNSPFYRFLLNTATGFCVKLLGIHIKVTGLETLPGEGRFLLVSNHRSNFDPILTWHVLKDADLAFISKGENFHIPIFGRIIRRCCFLEIDRENPRSALTTINKAAKLLEDGQVSIGVYPEGTRSKDCILLPFHNGVFKIAQKAEVPVVVACIQGTENIHKNWFRRPSQVQLDILDVLPASFVKENRTCVIGQRVSDTLRGALEEKKG